MSIKSELLKWYYNEFQTTSLYTRMIEVAENSPWHRERSVATHTDMAVAEYISTSPYDWDIMEIKGFFTVVFHDVGKPSAETINFREDCGEYRSYRNHGQKSARLWENYVCENWELFSNFGLEYEHIYEIGWLIENHLPWEIKNSEKRNNLADTILKIFKIPDDKFVTKVFFDILKSDQQGRISDNADEKISNANIWFCKFQDLLVERVQVGQKDEKNHPKLFIPIGASGCGKSTYFDKINQDNVEKFSLDNCRLNFYTSSEEQDTNAISAYKKAYNLSVDDENFIAKCYSQFIRLIKSGANIYVDNTNLTKKRRRFYLTEANRRNYYTIAILFPTSSNKLIERDKYRKDKILGNDEILRQYNSINLPSYGEFDKIVVHSSNVTRD